MIKTMFLTDQTDNYLEFKNATVLPATYKKLNFQDKFTVVRDILDNTNKIKMFDVSSGDVYLKHSNSIYCMEYMPHNCDIVLPANPKRLDWVVLHYEPGTVAGKFKINDMKTHVQKWVIRAKKERIMGLDENLVCDMPFIALRLTYIDKEDGWVVT